MYPEMFINVKMEDESLFYRGYGLGGLEVLEGLPDRICNLVMILKHYSLILITLS